MNTYWLLLLFSPLAALDFSPYLPRAYELQVSLPTHLDTYHHSINAFAAPTFTGTLQQLSLQAEVLFAVTHRHGPYTARFAQSTRYCLMNEDPITLTPGLAILYNFDKTLSDPTTQTHASWKDHGGKLPS